MVEHVNDIIQRINFTLSLSSLSRPASSVKKNSKHNTKDSLSKANISFEDVASKDVIPVEAIDSLVVSSLQDCLWVMNIQYFGNNSQTIPPESVEKSFSVSEYKPKPQMNDEEVTEFKSSVKLSKGVTGYTTFKTLLMHMYQMIINRLVRTAHLADLSNDKKSNKGKKSSKLSTAL